MQPINLPSNFPGIGSLFISTPETAVSLQTLVKTLLRNPHPTLSVAERELIAAYVSRLNTCSYCCKVHGARGPLRLVAHSEILKLVFTSPANAPITDRVKSLLDVAECVRVNQGNVSNETIEAARGNGATDKEIYDIKLIADAFCMYNCYAAGSVLQTVDNEPDVNLRDYAYNQYFHTPFALAINNPY